MTEPLLQDADKIYTEQLIPQRFESYAASYPLLYGKRERGRERKREGEREREASGRS